MQRDRKILSIDGSGFRALTQLGLLEYLMKQVNQGHPPDMADKCPADVFDLICGTAAGGLLAILLGRLGMSCERARDTYLDLERRLFTQGNQRQDGSWELLTSTATFGTTDFQDELKRVVKRQLGAENAPDNDPRFQMLVPPGTPTTNQKYCRTLVTVMRSDRPTGDTDNNKAYANGDDDAVRVRSYQPRNNNAPAPTTWTVWDAAIGTTACPKLFSPVDIQSQPTSSGLFQAASASGFANPSMIAYLEALDLFGTRSDPPPLTLVSLGMGIRNRHDYTASDDISEGILAAQGFLFKDSEGTEANRINKDRAKAFLKQTQLISVATRIKDLRVSALIQRSGSSQRYFRFDPPETTEILL
ncbi:acyl transferase/acyl hydrolase/lysophospholipase [Rhodocollybia butyracea]|uniref:Acyl transferase/acyl hydrolase/lysophospholipase n=1 Tax=Rhodocollybia butyracea TaxID=206335 RepID=A0A9P5TW12_9AGAR|nr:acyl transferase/acyl hydrolase/lysophospholipase [Rhodocollybia butyracea]